MWSEHRIWKVRVVRVHLVHLPTLLRLLAYHYGVIDIRHAHGVRAANYNGMIVDFFFFDLRLRPR